MWHHRPHKHTGCTSDDEKVFEIQIKLQSYWLELLKKGVSNWKNGLGAEVGVDLFKVMWMGARLVWQGERLGRRGDVKEGEEEEEDGEEKEEEEQGPQPVWDGEEGCGGISAAASSALSSSDSDAPCNVTTGQQNRLRFAKQSQSDQTAKHFQTFIQLGVLFRPFSYLLQLLILQLSLPTFRKIFGAKYLQTCPIMLQSHFLRGPESRHTCLIFWECWSNRV